MKKKIGRYYKVIRAEVVVTTMHQGKPIDLIVDCKEFNSWKGPLFGIEPTKETYIKAHLWADNVIALHKDFGMS